MTSYQMIKGQIPKTVQIIAVSKLQPVQKIMDLYSLGQRDFAENYVQEALPKMAEIQPLVSLNSELIRWHFIGRLQTNKAKKVVGKFDFIHSVDSLHLAQEIHHVAADKGIVQKILIQVNIAKETTKTGLTIEEFRNLLPQLQDLNGLRITGLMTMPPLLNSAEENRTHFSRLRELKTELSKDLPSLTELSMGTSQDFKVAIEEGSTMVRLGTILFGDRITAPSGKF